MWPSTRLSSAATAASASATGSPASAARSSMAESSKATASALPARTGTSQRSANALAISDLPAVNPSYTHVKPTHGPGAQAHKHGRGRTSGLRPPRAQPVGQHGEHPLVQARVGAVGQAGEHSLQQHDEVG